VIALAVRKFIEAGELERLEVSKAWPQ